MTQPYRSSSFCIFIFTYTDHSILLVTKVVPICGKSWTTKSFDEKPEVATWLSVGQSYPPPLNSDNVSITHFVRTGLLCPTHISTFLVSVMRVVPGVPIPILCVPEDVRFCKGWTLHLDPRCQLTQGNCWTTDAARWARFWSENRVKLSLLTFLTFSSSLNM